MFSKKCNFKDIDVLTSKPFHFAKKMRTGLMKKLLKKEDPFLTSLRT